MIRKFFGDGERDFALPAKWILALETETGAGFGTLLQRLRSHEFRFADVTQTIRLSLIGAGTSAEEADRLVRTYVGTEGNPLIEAQILATEILLDIWAGKGTPDEQA